MSAKNILNYNIGPRLCTYLAINVVKYKRPLGVVYVEGGCQFLNAIFRVTWDRCYDFLNIFAEKFSEKTGVFD
jgi:hypothetical protein